MAVRQVAPLVLGREERETKIPPGAHLSVAWTSLCHVLRTQSEARADGQARGFEPRLLQRHLRNINLCHLTFLKRCWKVGRTGSCPQENSVNQSKLILVHTCVPFAFTRGFSQSVPPLHQGWAPASAGTLTPTALCGESSLTSAIHSRLLPQEYGPRTISADVAG